jgi:hypothetical protein
MPKHTRLKIQESPTIMILAERERQKYAEVYSFTHDDQHVNGELAMAAACYAMPAKARIVFQKPWPFEVAAWKPTPDDRIRELVKAGALIVAEIERLQRKQHTK